MISSSHSAWERSASLKNRSKPPSCSLTVAEVLTGDAIQQAAPLATRAFHKGYSDRLQDKLQQKENQIRRAQRLVETVPTEQRLRGPSRTNQGPARSDHRRATYARRPAQPARSLIKATYLVSFRSAKKDRTKLTISRSRIQNGFQDVEFNTGGKIEAEGCDRHLLLDTNSVDIQIGFEVCPHRGRPHSPA